MSLHILLQFYNVPVQGAKLCNELKKTKLNATTILTSNSKESKIKHLFSHWLLFLP